MRVGCQTVCQRHHDREDHGSGTNNGSADKDRLGRRLECIACPVIFFEQMFRAAKVYFHIEVSFNLRFHIWHLLD